MTNIDMTFYLNHMTHICITYHILTKYGSLLLCKILGNVCYYFSMLHIMSIVHWYLYFFSLFLVGGKTWLGVESGWARTEVLSLYCISVSVNIVNCSLPTSIVRSRVVCLFALVWVIKHFDTGACWRRKHLGRGSFHPWRWLWATWGLLYLLGKELRCKSTFWLLSLCAAPQRCGWEWLFLSKSLQPFS